MRPLGYFMLPKSKKNFQKNFAKPLDIFLLGCYYIRVREKQQEKEQCLLHLQQQKKQKSQLT